MATQFYALFEKTADGVFIDTDAGSKNILNKDEKISSVLVGDVFNIATADHICSEDNIGKFYISVLQTPFCQNIDERCSTYEVENATFSSPVPILECDDFMKDVREHVCAKKGAFLALDMTWDSLITQDMCENFTMYPGFECSDIPIKFRCRSVFDHIMRSGPFSDTSNTSFYEDVLSCFPNFVEVIPLNHVSLSALATILETNSGSMTKETLLHVATVMTKKAADLVTK